MNALVSTSEAGQQTTRKPTVVKVGGVVAKVYSNPVKSNGSAYDSYLVRYPNPLTGRQGSRRFGSLADAKEFAEGRCRLVASGQASAAALTNEDASRNGESVELLRSLGVDVHVAVRSYVEAIQTLPPGTTLMEAVKFFAARHPAGAPRKLVSEVVAEFIEDRKSAGCSAIHLRDLRIRLGRFKDTVNVPVASMTSGMVGDYLRDLTNEKNGKPSSNRSKANVRALIVALFNFARLRKYIARDHAEEIGDLPVPKFRRGEVTVFTPAEFRRLLSEAPAEIVPSLAIAGLSGLRVAEVSRLDWSDVKLGERVIIVSDRIAKTASRRVVPVCDALAAWLAPHVRAFGPISPAGAEKDAVGNSLSKRFERVAADVGVTWKRNALRHSFGSFRLAVTSDVAKVSLEMGNSVAIVLQHYKSLVSEAEGEAWFAVVPDAEDAKVVTMHDVAEGSR